MNEKIDSEKLPAEPNVLCPTEFASPFLSAANAIDSQYDELRKILLKIEELISERKIKELRLAGEELLRIVNARPSSQNEGCWNRESILASKPTREIIRPMNNPVGSRRRIPFHLWAT